MSKRGKARDFTMAQLGAALAQLEEARDMCVSALQVFLDPNEDKSGEDRSESIESAMMSAQGAAFSLQEAHQGIAHMTQAELEMPEPHYAATDDDETEDDDEDIGDEEGEEDGSAE